MESDERFTQVSSVYGQYVHNPMVVFRQQIESVEKLSQVDTYDHVTYE